MALKQNGSGAWNMVAVATRSRHGVVTITAHVYTVCVCVYVSLCVLVQPIFVKVERVLWFKIVFGVRSHN